MKWWGNVKYPSNWCFCGLLKPLPNFHVSSHLKLTPSKMGVPPTPPPGIWTHPKSMITHSTPGLWHPASVSVPYKRTGDDVARLGTIFFMLYGELKWVQFKCFFFLSICSIYTFTATLLQFNYKVVRTCIKWLFMWPNLKNKCNDWQILQFSHDL